MPYFSLCRRSACTTVAARMAPVAPSGWPSAMAPPIGFTFAGFSPSVLITASDCRKRLVQLVPADVVALQARIPQRRGIASMGPMPMISGGTPRAA